ncbi:cytochrome P450 4c3-like [Daphnia carinata]|uniref:cytochrome P450 4c3-like n=1 Tax=Daphnia carinata TaxID=120202 RepID=UPI0028693E3B|nr:cytochrome P450 4c3-like [Daphnia carinata]
MQMYGGIFRLWLGRYSYIIIGSPELIEPILSSPIIGSRPKECDVLKDYIGDSLALLGGEEWKQRRRMLAPAFHNQTLNSFIDTFNEKSVECARCLNRAVEVHKDVEFDILPMMTHFALDILCETAMGRKSNTEEKTDAYLGNSMA